MIGTASDRPHHAASDRRRAAFDRRADGQRALPHVLFLDHPRKPGSRRRPVRPRLQHAVRIRIPRRCISARCPAICAASRRRTARGREWHEGDCVIHNHPYYGASHSPDIAIVMPVFYGGELVGFSANTAHHVDIGAATPGLVIDIPDVFAEGMLFDGTEALHEGVRNEALWKFIRDNTRVPQPGDGRSRGADRLRRARRAALRGADRHATARTWCSQRDAAADGLYRAHAAPARSPRSPTATMSPKAFSTMTAATAACTLPLKVTVRVQRRRRRGRH